MKMTKSASGYVIPEKTQIKATAAKEERSGKLHLHRHRNSKLTVSCCQAVIKLSLILAYLLLFLLLP